MSEIRQIQLDGVNYDLVITEDEVSATAAAQSAAAAAQSATQAASSASAASTSATSAGTSATSAANSASAASGFADDAETSASEAASSVQTISEYAEAANASAQSASTSAGLALTAVDNATAKATEASGSASDAASSASDAAASESAAFAYAGNAETHANTAATYATNAANSASAALDAEQRAEAIVGLTIDDALSITSRNPVENRVITQALSEVTVPPELFWVQLTSTYNSQTDTTTYSADKTIDEIYTASESGMLPIVTYGINFYILAYRYAYNTTMQMFFARSLAGSGTSYCSAVSTNGTDTWNVSSISLASIDSPAFTGTPTAPTPTSSSGNGQIATKQYVDAEVDGVLPSQSGQSGKFLTTNGTTASWADAKELFLVTFTVDSNNIYSADHTMNEIAAAASAGKIVRGVLNDGSNGNLYFNNVKSYLFATTNYNVSGHGNASFVVLYGMNDGTSEFWARYEKELTLTTYTNIFVPSMSVVTIPYDDLETAYYSGSVVRALAPKSDGSYEYYVAESCSYRADASATGTMIFSNSNGKLILTYDPNGGTYEADKQSWQFISSVGAFIAIVNTTTYNELVDALATNVPIFAYAVGSTTKDLYQLVYYSGSAFIFTQPYYNSASSNGPALFSYSIDSTNTWTAMNTYLAPGTHNHSASNITSGTLSVARGGTGAATLTSGAVLIGNGTSAIATRSITNNTSSTALAANTNIPTMNTVKYGLDNRLNRTNAVHEANTSYTAYIARGEALNSADTNPTANGAISWTYA